MAHPCFFPHMQPLLPVPDGEEHVRVKGSLFVFNAEAGKYLPYLTEAEAAVLEVGEFQCKSCLWRELLWMLSCFVQS